MSTIDSIYSSMLATIQTALPSYTRLSNPNKSQDNADAFLRNGFGVVIGSSSKERVMSGTVGQRRQMDFILTKEVVSTENDYAAKSSVELSLMNDQLLVLKALELDFTQNGAVLQIAYESDSGVQFVANNEKFLELKTTVSVIYSEPVT